MVDTEFGWKDIGSLYANLTDEDKASWCIENGGTNVSSNLLTSAEMFSSKKVKKDRRAYCSFLIQKDTESYERTLKKLPFKSFESLPWNYETALWVFFGRNSRGQLPLQGRLEHTDSVHHDGTWHFQLSGQKTWTLRPTKELLERSETVSATVKDGELLKIECNEGDILVVNTRLWFHRTEIPAQDGPSVSYARDFRFADTSKSEPIDSATMTNIDGLYATADIDAGTILFTEDSMPECELHRSPTDPNCELVELESGVMAVVSSVAIKSGEFFCIAESDDESSDENDVSYRRGV